LARRSEKIEQLAQELQGSGTIHAVKCDVSDLNSIKAAFDWIEQKFTYVHIIVNNAGILAHASSLDDSDEAIDRVINTNLTGLVHCTRKSVQLMKKSNDYGIVINVSSILGSSIPYTFKTGIYSATKYAVRAFSEVARQELVESENEKIRITNLSPGVVETEIFEISNLIPDDQKFLKQTAHLKAEDISQGVLYVLSTPYTVNVSQLTIKPVGEKI
jgi:NADP+-dependent farnesol dehydrogenase